MYARGKASPVAGNWYVCSEAIFLYLTFCTLELLFMMIVVIVVQEIYNLFTRNIYSYKKEFNMEKVT